MRTCLKCGNKNKNNATFCRECGEKLQSIICSACKAKYDKDVKFCEQCGGKIEVPEISFIQVKPTPGHGITIEFGYSSSQSLPSAINQAKKYDTFVQLGLGKNAVYRVTFQKDQLKDLGKMLQHFGYMRNKKVYIEGEEKPWNGVFRYCFIEKIDSYKSEKHCFEGAYNDQFNIWGCYDLNLYFHDSLDPDDSAIPCWFSWGYFTENWDFVFDKDKIKTKLEEELFRVEDCPAIDKQFVMDVLEFFPDRVNPEKDKNWTWMDEYGSPISKVIIKNNEVIPVIETENEKGVIEEEGLTKIVGVTPKDRKAAEEILKNIKEKISRRIK